MSKKFVYQVGNNKKVILWCTANQISTHEMARTYSKTKRKCHRISLYGVLQI